MTDSSAESRAQSYVNLVDGFQALFAETPAGFADALRDMNHMFEELGIPFAVIGALAVAIYVPERRSTQDIDVVASPRHILKIRTNAAKYGFAEVTQEDDVPIRRFRHRAGVALDIISDPEGGFADVTRARVVSIPEIGRIPFASRAEIAYCKLLTQDPVLQRKGEKRLTDKADLVALLRVDHSLPEQLSSRLGGGPGTFRYDATIPLRNALRDACAAAGVPAPTGPGASALRQLVIVAAGIVLLVGAMVLAVVGGGAALNWLSATLHLDEAPPWLEDVAHWGIAPVVLIVALLVAYAIGRRLRGRTRRGDQ